MKKFRNFLNRINWKEIPASTYVRYILMLLAIINMILSALGLNPIEVSETELYKNVSDILTVLILIANTWFNNSVTNEALDADQYMKQLVKEGKKDAQ